MLRGFALDSLFKDAAKGIASNPHAPKCDCGCVPNVMSLHDQARERARRRAEKAAAEAAAADKKQEQVVDQEEEEECEVIACEAASE